MPARLEEVKHAKEEGIDFLTLHNPVEYIADEDGAVKQAVLAVMTLGEPDASGRRSPVDTGERVILDAKQHELAQLAKKNEDYSTLADEIDELREQKQEILVENVAAKLSAKLLLMTELLLL